MSTIAQFPTPTRVHIALDVRSVEAALPFYEALFGQRPTKVREGYAKFEVLDPPVHLSLNESAARRPEGSVAHFGIQLKSTEEVLARRAIAVEKGLQVLDEQKVTCCYSVQDKFWVVDSDGHRWEYFVVIEDADVHSLPREDAKESAAAEPKQRACCPLLAG